MCYCGFKLSFPKTFPFCTESFAALHNLSKKEIIFLDDVQQEFKPDLQHFITGATLSLQNGKLIIGHNLYKRWLNKIKTEGFVMK